ncbi:hypothetical protein N7527_003954 [Penicillium freii]|nr:hypothetical protein N7527_003954 [Penicillium freii]
MQPVAETHPILTNGQLEELSELTSRAKGRAYGRKMSPQAIAVITNKRKDMLAVNPNCYTHAHLLSQFDYDLGYLNRRLCRIQTEECEDTIPTTNSSTATTGAGKKPSALAQLPTCDQ